MNNLIASLSVASVFTWILGIALCLLAGVITVLVSLQNTNEGGLSGTLAGGNSDSFFGKSKTMTKERRLDRWTLIGSIVFVVLVLVTVILVSATYGA
ncbi:MAG: preprotein translocase subunit SecG [Ruminococcaceae bacterium]|nr:preprotein translocase subunit SecG [Oscillospiraceae bacterium]